jgi:5-methylcytosine-specific restriction enzyme subunit McrC
MEDQADSLRPSPRAIYFLMSYAWGFYDPRDELLAAATEYDSPAELLFLALSNAASRILRRGSDRSYRERVHTGASIRGRLDVGGTLRIDRGLSRTAVSVFEELSPECPQNNVIKSALALAKKLPGLEAKVRERARLLERAFPGTVAATRSAALSELKAARIHRNNSGYRQALLFSRLILSAMRPAEGTWRFVDPFDHAYLNRVFEEFLRVFFARDLRGQAIVGVETLRWNDAPGGVSSLLPIMRTDISIRGPRRCMVIDAKYYALPFVVHHGKKTIRSSHLYQISSYGRVSRETDPMGRPWTGVLVYARCGEEFDLSYDLRGLPVRIVGIDLEAAPERILETARGIWVET